MSGSSRGSRAIRGAHKYARTGSEAHIHRPGLLLRVPDAQLAVVVVAPALYAPPRHDHARMVTPQVDGGGRDAWHRYHNVAVRSRILYGLAPCSFPFCRSCDVSDAIMPPTSHYADPRVSHASGRSSNKQQTLSPFVTSHGLSSSLFCPHKNSATTHTLVFVRVSSTGKNIPFQLNLNSLSVMIAT